MHMETVLTDALFAQLLDMEKVFEQEVILPTDVEKKAYNIKSADGTEHFVLNVERGRVFELVKSKLNTSYRKIPIVRVEFNSRPHRNPDGQKIGRDHIHIYKEGYGMSWAYDLESFNEKYFHTPENFDSLFVDFCSYCNIMYTVEDIQTTI